MDNVSNKTYLVFNALSNMVWTAIVAIMAASCWAVRKRQAHFLAPLAVLSAGASLHLMVVHGMAEGDARHYMAWSWVPVVGALALVRQEQRPDVSASQLSCSELISN